MARIGELRKRVTFQRPDRVDDGGGGGAIHWTGVLQTWGELVLVSDREKLAGGRLESAGIGTLTVRSSRASRAIDASYSVLIDGEAWQIRAVGNPDMRNRFISMTVEVGVAL